MVRHVKMTTTTTTTTEETVGSKRGQNAKSTRKVLPSQASELVGEAHPLSRIDS